MTPPDGRSDGPSAQPSAGTPASPCTGTPASASAEPPRPRSPAHLFLVFSGLALRGFGGVLPWAQRVIVEERRWLTREQFVEVLAFAQLLPGPNVCNLAIMLGDRWFGVRGALAALAGMLVAPAALVLTLAALYGRLADDPLVRRMLVGMIAVAGGMILGTAARLAGGHRGHPGWFAFGAVAFVGVGVLRLKLAWVIAVVAPAAVAAAWWANRRDARAGGTTPR